MVYQKYVYITLPFYRFEVSAAAIFYPITFLITDLITELFGKERTQYCIRLSIAMNIIVALMIIFMDDLKSTPWSKIDDRAFHEIFGFFGVGFIATITANYISRTLDLYMYVALHKITKAKYGWFRSTITTTLSIFVDTCLIWTFLALLNALPMSQLWTIILNSYSWKLFFTLVSSPLFYISIKTLKNFGVVTQHLEKHGKIINAVLTKPLATE